MDSPNRAKSNGDAFKQSHLVSNYINLISTYWHFLLWNVIMYTVGGVESLIKNSYSGLK